MNWAEAWKHKAKFYKGWYELTYEVARNWQAKCFKQADMIKAARRWSAAWKCKAKYYKSKTEFYKWWGNTVYMVARYLQKREAKLSYENQRMREVIIGLHHLWEDTPGPDRRPLVKLMKEADEICEELWPDG